MDQLRGSGKLNETISGARARWRGAPGGAAGVKVKEVGPGLRLQEDRPPALDVTLSRCERMTMTDGTCQQFPLTVHHYYTTYCGPVFVRWRCSRPWCQKMAVTLPPAIIPRQVVEKECFHCLVSIRRCTVDGSLIGIWVPEWSQSNQSSNLCCLLRGTAISTSAGKQPRLGLHWLKQRIVDCAVAGVA